MVNDLEKLHSAVSEKFDVGDFNSFQAKMQSTEDRKRFYDVVSEKGLDLGDYNEYENRLKKKEPTQSFMEAESGKNAYQDGGAQSNVATTLTTKATTAKPNQAEKYQKLVERNYQKANELSIIQNEKDKINDNTAIRDNLSPMAIQKAVFDKTAQQGIVLKKKADNFTKGIELAKKGIDPTSDLSNQDYVEVFDPEKAKYHNERIKASVGIPDKAVEQTEILDKERKGLQIKEDIIKDEFDGISENVIDVLKQNGKYNEYKTQGLNDGQIVQLAVDTHAKNIDNPQYQAVENPIREDLDRLLELGDRSNTARQDNINLILGERFKDVKLSQDEADKAQQEVDKEEGYGVARKGARIFKKIASESAKIVADLPNMAVSFIDNNTGDFAQGAMDKIKNFTLSASMGVEANDKKVDEMNPTKSNKQLGMMSEFVEVNGNKVFVDDNGNATEVRDKNNYKLFDEKEVDKTLEAFNSLPKKDVKKLPFGENLGLATNKVGETMIDMASLVGTTAIGGGSRLASMMAINGQMYNGLVEHGIDKGLTREEAENFGFLASNGIALASMFNPMEAKIASNLLNKGVKNEVMAGAELITKGLNGKNYKEMAAKVAKGFVEANKSGAKEGFEESVLEPFAQYLVEKNYDERGKGNFDPSMKQDIETWAVSYGTGAIMGGAEYATRKNDTEAEKNAIYQAIISPEALDNYLASQKSLGLISDDKIEAIKDRIGKVRTDLEGLDVSEADKRELAMLFNKKSVYNEKLKTITNEVVKKNVKAESDEIDVEIEKILNEEPIAEVKEPIIEEKPKEEVVEPIKVEEVKQKVVDFTKLENAQDLAEIEKDNIAEIGQKIANGEKLTRDEKTISNYHKISNALIEQDKQGEVVQKVEETKVVEEVKQVSEPTKQGVEPIEKLETKEAKAIEVGDESMGSNYIQADSEQDFKNQYAEYFFKKPYYRLDDKEASEVDSYSKENFKGSGYYNEEMDDFVGDYESALRSFWGNNEEKNTNPTPIEEVKPISESETNKEGSVGVGGDVEKNTTVGYKITSLNKMGVSTNDAVQLVGGIKSIDAFLQKISPELREGLKSKISEIIDGKKSKVLSEKESNIIRQQLYAHNGNKALANSLTDQLQSNIFWEGQQRKAKLRILNRDVVADINYVDGRPQITYTYEGDDGINEQTIRLTSGKKDKLGKTVYNDFSIKTDFKPKIKAQSLKETTKAEIKTNQNESTNPKGLDENIKPTSEGTSEVVGEAKPNEQITEPIDKIRESAINDIKNNAINNTDDHVKLNDFLNSQLDNIGDEYRNYIADLPIGIESWDKKTMTTPVNKVIFKIPIVEDYFKFKKKYGISPKIERSAKPSNPAITTKSTDNSKENKEAEAKVLETSKDEAGGKISAESEFKVIEEKREYKGNKNADWVKVSLVKDGQTYIQGVAVETQVSKKKAIEKAKSLIKEQIQQENGKDKKPKRIRKSKAIVEAIESETEVVANSKDAERATELIESIERAEEVILSGELDESFEKKYGVSEVDLATELNSLQKYSANVETAYKNLTGIELLRENIEEIEIDFLNAINKEGIKLKTPINIESGVVLQVTPKQKSPLKTKGVASLSDIVAKDDFKPALNGVFFDSGNYVATDATQLVIVKAQEPIKDITAKLKSAFVKANEKLLGNKKAIELSNKIDEDLKDGLDGKILHFRKGEVVDEKYPNYRDIIPSNTIKTKSIPIQELIDIANGGVAAFKNVSSQATALDFRFNGAESQDFGVNPQSLLNNLLALQANGAKNVVLGISTPNRAITIEADNGDFGLIMPVILDSQSFNGNKKVTTSNPIEYDVKETTKLQSTAEPFKKISSEAFKGLIEKLQKAFPNVKVNLFKSEDVEKILGDSWDKVKKQVDAWHGSPHSFDKFSLDKIGSGEGAQAFGWGLYFTDLKGVADNYAEQISKRFIKDMYDSGEEMPQAAYDALEEVDFLGYSDEWAAADTFYKRTKQTLIDGFDVTEEQYNKINNALLGGKRNLYKVSLHKGKQPSEYNWLEWDKPVSNDTIKNVIKGLNSLGIKAKISHINGSGNHINIGESNYSYKTNEGLYRSLVSIFGKNGQYLSNNSSKQASLFLLENGIDGIKYPAESIARGTTSDNARGFNYVVFDENAVSIEDKVQFMKRPNGEVYGFVKDGQVYLNEDMLNANTPLHEFGHIWENMFPKEFSKGIDILKKSEKGRKLIAQIKKNKGYANLTPSQIEAEALVTAIGNKGEGIFNGNPSLFKKFKEWLGGLFTKISEKLGFEVNADTKFDQFTKGVVKDLLGGKELVGESEQKGGKSVQFSIADVLKRFENENIETFKTKGEQALRDELSKDYEPDEVDEFVSEVKEAIKAEKKETKKIIKTFKDDVENIGANTEDLVREGVKSRKDYKNDLSEDLVKPNDKFVQDYHFEDAKNVLFGMKNDFGANYLKNAYELFEKLAETNIRQDSLHSFGIAIESEIAHIFKGLVENEFNLQRDDLLKIYKKIQKANVERASVGSKVLNATKNLYRDVRMDLMNEILTEAEQLQKDAMLNNYEQFLDEAVEEHEEVEYKEEKIEQPKPSTQTKLEYVKSVADSVLEKAKSVLNKIICK